MEIRIGTRGSMLAMWQTGYVREVLAEYCPGDTFELVRITTRGDRVQDRPLPAVGGKGLFTRELEESMLDGRIDLAVHSCKDLPTDLPDGLLLGAVLPRDDPRDALIGAALGDLSVGACVGTSSLRRQAQLLAMRPDLRVEPVRGNVDTRLRKQREGRHDALLMAAAGLERLGLRRAIAQVFDPEEMVPAPAQGAIAVECRAGDEGILERLQRIACPETTAEVLAERHVLHALAGGCHTPMGIHAATKGNAMRLIALVATPDGMRQLRAQATRPAGRALEAAEEVVEALRAMGVDALLAEIRAAQDGA